MSRLQPEVSLLVALTASAYTCRETPDCRGIMYTTWEIKYELLGDFGRLCFGR